RGLETGMNGLDPILDLGGSEVPETLQRELSIPGAERIRYVGDALRYGMSVDEVHELTAIDPWFLAEIDDLIVTERTLDGRRLADVGAGELYELKRKGFSDARLAELLGVREDDVRAHRQRLGIRPVYRRVDTCAAEFPAATAYLYSTYEEECEANPTGRRKIMVLGGGPNRIGQGIEFDYCCVYAALAMRE